MKLFRDCLHRPTKPRDGHKVFRNDDGQISLCDYSGAYPEQTDDGPLLVMQDTVVTVTVYRGALVYTVPVSCPRDHYVGRVWVSTETMRALSSFVRLKVKRSPEFEALRQDVDYAAGFPQVFA